VALEVIDAYPSAAAAVATAEARRPDVLFGPYGTGPAVVAAAASAGVVWNHVGATARLARPAFERVINLPAPAATYLAAVVKALVADGLPAGSEIVLLHGDTGFGREVAEGTAATAAQPGLVVHAVGFPQGQGPAAFEGRQEATCCSRPDPSRTMPPSPPSPSDTGGGRLGWWRQECTSWLTP
jgi:hypothetical protein